MPFKKHTPEEIIGKLREVEIVLAQGGTTADAWSLWLSACDSAAA
jgi:putative transposase